MRNDDCANLALYLLSQQICLQNENLLLPIFCMTYIQSRHIYLAKFLVESFWLPRQAKRIDLIMEGWE